MISTIIEIIGLLSDIVLIIIGVVLGFISSAILSRIQDKQIVSRKLIEQYFVFRVELVTLLSKLADPDYHEYPNAEMRRSYRKELAQITYKHYDYIPIEVLHSLILLHAALSGKRGHIYQMSNRTVKPIDIENIEQFVAQTSFTENARVYSLKALKSRNENVRNIEAIRIHARFALETLNENSRPKELMKITKQFRKGWGNIK